MMRVACLLGSPRRHGNTAKITGWVLDELTEMGHEVEKIDIVDLDISGCRECYACKREPGFPGCVVDDDFGQLSAHLLAADVIVFATPLFAWSYPAQLKAPLDRMGSLLYDYPGSPDYASQLEGKATALIVTCGGPEENNTELLTTTHERIAQIASLRNIGSFVFPGCLNPEDIGSAAKFRASEVAQVIAAG
jgi:multimeric flavodoxin WrbA